MIYFGPKYFKEEIVIERGEKLGIFYYKRKGEGHLGEA